MSARGRRGGMKRQAQITFRGSENARCDTIMVGICLNGATGGSVVKNPPAHAKRRRGVGLARWVGKIPWKRAAATTLCS